MAEKPRLLRVISGWFFAELGGGPGTPQPKEHLHDFAKVLLVRQDLSLSQPMLELRNIKASRAFQSRSERVVHKVLTLRAVSQAGPFGNVQNDTLRGAQELVDNRVALIPRGCELRQPGYAAQCSIVNFEFFQRQHLNPAPSAWLPPEPSVGPSAGLSPGNKCPISILSHSEWERVRLATL